MQKKHTRLRKIQEQTFKFQFFHQTQLPLKLHPLKAGTNGPFLLVCLKILEIEEPKGTMSKKIAVLISFRVYLNFVAFYA